MPSVHLDFVPPPQPDVDKLLIYESPTQDGIFTLIETVTPVGTYPNYISEYTTDDATSTTNWFAIKWGDTKGWVSDISESIQGGTETLLGEIVQRVMLRDISANENIVMQEAEAVIEQVLGAGTHELIDVSKRKLSGMVLLTLARVQLGKVLTSSGSVSEFAAGLIRVKTGNQTSVRDNIRALMDEAASLLGISKSIVAQMAIPEVAGGAAIVSADLSRLIVEIE
jgi:hypothetical protein